MDSPEAMIPDGMMPDRAPVEAPIEPAPDGRFARRREAVIDAATDILNRRGLGGLTLVEVARTVGLGTSSVTYYFRRKDLLAAAAFAESLARIEAIVAACASAASPRERVSRFVRAQFGLHYRIRIGAERPLAVLSELRALDDQTAAPLIAHYQAIFRQVRGFFDQPASEQHAALNTVRAQVLTETMFWMPVWAFDYAYRDLEGVCTRLLDVLQHGIAARGHDWRACEPHLEPEHDFEDARADFLRVAGLMISDRGYRNASIARIAAQRKVSKGSFYHHHAAKDQLVLECFRVSFARIATILRHGSDRSGWDRLNLAIARLLALQFDSDWPLMRTTALQTLPFDLRSAVLARSARTSASMAGLIADGVIDGSLRRVDPLLAAMVIMPGINAAIEQRGLAHRITGPCRLRDLYASVLVHGLFDARALDPDRTRISDCETREHG